MSEHQPLRMGILTIHAALNYGSMLQAYALQSTLESLAPDSSVELIDYLPGIIMDRYASDIRKHLKNMPELAKWALTLRTRYRKNRAFRGFASEYFHLSPKSYEREAELQKDAQRWNVCILGSDQVWNPDIIGNDKTFFLDFASDSLKASFASSFGTEKVNGSFLNMLLDSLQSFEHLAVREASAARILEPLQKPVFVSCDPVFLMSGDQWRSMARRPKQVPDHYILYYSVQRNDAAENLARKLSAHYGLPIVDAGSRNNPLKYIGLHDPDIGPAEFLYLVDHADFVVTNSFHGTAFGTIFRKKCISLVHRTRGTRIRELAQLAERGEYLVDEHTAPADVIALLDREVIAVGGGLAQTIAGSRDYLKNVIRSAYDRVR